MRVYLRALKKEDFKTTIKWRNDPEVTKYLGSKSRFVSEYDEKKWFEDYIKNKNDKNLRLAVCLKETNQHIGNIYLLNIDLVNRNAEYAILIGEKQYWGKGLGTEGTDLILIHAFNELGLERVYLYVIESHVAAIKLYEKCGFAQEGVLRNSLFKNGTFHNQIVMSILASEYKKKQ